MRRFHESRSRAFRPRPRKFVGPIVWVLLWACRSSVAPAESPAEISARLAREGLAHGRAHAMLTELCTQVGHRVSGSPGAEKAVAWSKRTMEACGLEKVRLGPVMVPRWVRGETERASYRATTDQAAEARPLRVSALGGSVGTPERGLDAGVLEVKSFDELRAAGEKARGKIIFFNRPFDRSHFEPGAAYGGAIDQRSRGASEAARAGGIAALVRSMTGQIDDSPHTGMMTYDENVKQVPAAAVSTLGAERLAEALARDPNLHVQLELSCRSMPDVLSHNVLGEIVGRELPGEVVVIGGHLDSWDVGQGAHDDGAGCVHAIEALRLLNKLGLKPKRTIRAVMFMNEENGLRGGLAYAAVERPGETTIAAIESDTGGFLPLGFGVGGGDAVFEAVSRWAPRLAPIGCDRIRRGGGGADIGPLMAKGVPGFGLLINTQRYFEFHHTEKDRIEAVNDRELELGAIAMAIMSYNLAEEGLPRPSPAPASASAR